MKKMLKIILASIVLVGSGCATVDPGRAQKLDLYREGGPGPDPAVVESFMNLGKQNKGFGEDGYLVAFSPGDELKLQFKVSSEIADSQEHEPVTVALKSPL
ncbi:MAG: hypothetical protein ACWA44_05110 [Thiotrichales bacterium]